MIQHKDSALMCSFEVTAENHTHRGHLCKVGELISVPKSKLEWLEKNRVGKISTKSVSLGD